MAVSGVSAQVSAGDALASQQAFRNADFLSIMLAEVTNQDPLQPAETGKMVENMKALQELANTNYEKFRADVRWAQDMVGKTVNVNQVIATEAERAAYANRGLKPDVGYGNLDGRVEGFRVVGETVWVSIGGKDYPVDNIKQVRSGIRDPDALARASNQLLGMRIRYRLDDPTKTAEGVVTSVGWDAAGGIRLGVGNTYVAYDRIEAITVPPKP